MPAKLTHHERAVGAIRHAIRNKQRDVSIVGLNITEIPEEILQVPRLQWLSIERCKITALPEWLRRCKDLKLLSLTKNRITHLPEWLPDLEKLESFNVSNNELDSLPESFGRCKRINELCLDGNKLTGFPEQLVALKSLEILYIGGNSLGRFPESISRLTELHNLDAHNAALNALPASMLKMKNLSCVVLEGNPALGLPRNIVGTGCNGASARKVLEYYFTHVAPLTGKAKAKLRPKPDMFDKVRDAGTAWEEYSNKQIIDRLKKWSRVCSFVINSARQDTIDFTFQTLPADLNAFVRDVEELCPDVTAGFECYADVIESAGETGYAIPEDIAQAAREVDLSSDDAGLELLKRSLQQEKKLTLWWD